MPGKHSRNKRKKTNLRQYIYKKNKNILGDIFFILCRLRVENRVTLTQNDMCNMNSIFLQHDSLRHNTNNFHCTIIYQFLGGEVNSYFSQSHQFEGNANCPSLRFELSLLIPFSMLLTIMPPMFTFLYLSTFIHFFLSFLPKKGSRMQGFTERE